MVIHQSVPKRVNQPGVSAGEPIAGEPVQETICRSTSPTSYAEKYWSLT
jgi:hypothetical protein